MRPALATRVYGALVLASFAGACAFGPFAPTLRVAGTSSVGPLTQAVADELRATRSDVRVRLETAGTGAGLRSLCEGRADVADASRPIKRSELEACAERGIAFLELMVAYDAVVVVVHPSNDFADSLRVGELGRIWEPGAEGRVTRWSDVRPGWPERPLVLAAPDSDSGSYDYFTRAVTGEEGVSRGDYHATPDHDQVAAAVAAEPDALGFLSLLAWKRHEASLRAVAIDDENARNGRGPVLPDDDSLRAGRYQPLGRPLLVYAATAQLVRREVTDFLRTYLHEGAAAAERVGLVPLPADVYQSGSQRLQRRLAGTAFEGGSRVGLSRTTLLDLDLEQLMELELPAP